MRMRLRAAFARFRHRYDPIVFGWTAQAAIAAGLAWELARQIPGHPQPFFAPIAAVIALGAERGRRGRQAVELLTGVAIGIVLGSSVVALFGAGGWQIMLAVALAFLLGTGADARPLTLNESAVSAVLIVGLHRTGSHFAYNRLIDALIGGGLAIVSAQILFPVDPLEIVRSESRRLRDELAATLEQVATALADHDRARAEAALAQIDAIDERRLHEALELARDVARRAPRRWAERRRLEPVGDLVRSLDAAVGDTRALVTGALRTIGAGEAVQRDAIAAIALLAAAIRTTDPAVSHDSAQQALELSVPLESSSSLGLGVLAHAIASIADDVVGTARAREEANRVAPVRRGRLQAARRRLPDVEPP
jgi:Fusaric acid resistance protein-like